MPRRTYVVSENDLEELEEVIGDPVLLLAGFDWFATTTRALLQESSQRSKKEREILRRRIADEENRARRAIGVLVWIFATEEERREIGKPGRNRRHTPKKRRG